MGRALIIGGGLGGLSAAIALRRAGVDVTVFEQSPELLEVGAGVGLQVGAIKALKRMGMLAPIVEIAGDPIEALELRSHRSGRVLARIPQREVGGDVGLFALNVHRGELLSELAAGAGAEVIRKGAQCTGFEQDAHGVVARFADGGEERGALLIGADGLHSAIRRQLHGDTELRYGGYTVWRSMPEFSDERISDRYPHQAVGPGGSFGLHPRRELMYWFAPMARPQGTPDHAQGHKHELLELFGGWYDPIPAVIEATPEEAIYRTDIFDRRPLERWGEGRVTLLGDAAHPTTPSMGHGAGMAIEDAAVIGEELSLSPGLADGDAIEAALRAYEGRRRPLTKRIVNMSWRLSRIYNWRNPLAAGARDTFLRLAPSFVQRKPVEAEVASDL